MVEHKVYAGMGNFFYIHDKCTYFYLLYMTCLVLLLYSNIAQDTNHDFKYKTVARGESLLMFALWCIFSNSLEYLTKKKVINLPVGRYIFPSEDIWSYKNDTRRY